MPEKIMWMKTGSIILILATLSIQSLGLYPVEARTETREMTVFLDTKGAKLFPTGGPWDFRAFSRATLYNAVLGQLFYVKKNGMATPGLIESWESEGNGRSWVLHLREDLKFHNGRSVTAKDLEFSIVRHLLSEVDTPEKALLQNISGAESVKAVTPYKTGTVSGVKLLDDRSIRISLKSSDSFLPQNYALSELSIVPQEELEADYLSWKRFPIGAGPYKIVSSATTGSLTLKSTGTYFDMLAASPEVIHFETDHARAASADIVIGAQQNPNPGKLTLDVLDVTSRIRVILFNYSTRLAKDINFRKAIYYALNRAQLASNVQGATPTVSMIPRSFGFIDEVEAGPNLEKAKFYLSQVSSPPEKIIIPIAKDGDVPEWMEILKIQLENIGLRVGFERTDKRMLEFMSESSPMEIQGFMPDVGDPITIFKIHREGGPYIPVLNPKGNSCAVLLEKIDASVNPEARRELVLELNRQFIESAYELPLFEEKLSYFVNNKKVLSLDEDYQLQTMVFHRLSIR